MLGSDCTRRMAAMLGAVMLVLYLGSAPAHAQGKPVVASVISIQGKLMCERPGKGIYAAFVQMPDFLLDRLTTDATSIAALEFTVGGKIGLNKSSTVEIIGTRGAADGSGNVLRVNNGAIWAKFDKQKSPLLIRTPSATLGIRGTEFLIECKADSTRIDVFEGKVAYAPGKDVVPDDAPVATAGMRIVIDSALKARVETYDVEKMRREDVLLFPDLAKASEALRIASNIVKYLPDGAAHSAALQDAAWHIDHTQEVVKAPLAAAQDAIDRADTQLSRIGITVPGLPTRPGLQKAVDFPVDLKPYQADAAPPSLVFSWTAFKDAPRYVVLVSKDENMEASNLTWAAQVKTTSATWPADGPPLEAGQKYYWRLVAMDAQGNALGKASQTWFVVPAGYQPR